MTMNERTARPSSKSFGFADFVVRWVGAIVLVMATYNPSGHSFVHWVMRAAGDSELGALHLLVGALLIAGWAVFVVATNRSLGGLGIVIGAVLIGAAIWLLAEVGLVTTDTTRALVWLGLFAVATLLAIGLSWSHIWRRLSGQLEVDTD